MKTKISIFCVIVCFIFTNIFSQNYPSEKQIKNIFSREIKNGRSNSFVIGILDNGTEKYYAFGNVFEGNNIPTNENTMYDICSITKIFTTTILAEMILENKLSLDTPLSAFLPDTVTFANKFGKEITLKHLATHTSGISGPTDKYNSKNKLEHHKNLDYNDFTITLIIRAKQ